jgi:hypothetical protein
MVGIMKLMLASVPIMVLGIAHTGEGLTSDSSGPEKTIRTFVRANAEEDLATLSQLMAHEGNITSHTISRPPRIRGPEFERDMREEFAAVQKFEIPVHKLKAWTKGDLAWSVMEPDYIRFVGNATDPKRTLLPLRETGVIERRYESFGRIHLDGPLAQRSASTAPQHLVGTVPPSDPDLSGEWEILEVEDDKRYTATLDKAGNGPYTQHGGQFVTTKFSDRLWQGTWQQPGNDREGGFEVLLSEDGTQAKGVWWYSRVGAQKNIPPREHGGTYSWKRLTPPPTAR